jgi:hypothetical protein
VIARRYAVSPLDRRRSNSRWTGQSVYWRAITYFDKIQNLEATQWRDAYVNTCKCLFFSSRQCVHQPLWNSTVWMARTHTLTLYHYPHLTFNRTVVFLFWTLHCIVAVPEIKIRINGKVMRSFVDSYNLLHFHTVKVSPTLVWQTVNLLPRRDQLSYSDTETSTRCYVNN